MASSTTNLAVAVLLLSSCLAFSRSEEARDGFEKCPPFPCGKFGNLTYPFEDMRQHKKCGFFSVDGCNERVPKFQFTNGTGNWYDLLDIYPNKTIHVRDQELERQLMMNSTRRCRVFNSSNPLYSSLNLPFTPIRIYPTIDLLRCNRTANVPPELHSAAYPNMSCGEYNIYYISKPLPDIQPQSCSIIQLPVANQTGEPSISKEWFHRIVSDFLLESPDELCQYASDDKFKCASQKNTGNGGNRNGGNQRIKHWIGIGGRQARRKPMVIGLAIAAVLVAVIALLVYCFWIRSMSNTYFFSSEKNKSHRNVEAILKTYGSLPPKRYTYSEVKKFTNSFENKLGEGGYGGVYKGTLPDSRAIAVKVLKESKGSGEEFINEVASISRTSHVNIVTLMGFCFERTKRALVYEFMPNGSLEKFIYDANIKSTTRQLGWETLFQIALGIARGLEYLHRGCNTRIVHFDIKPHNILLDEELCPKIADFGLSKLCSNRKDSILSMLGARGTPGYTAPEVFCRSVGNVSHKSDVYSYGMMVLEMVGGRKNIDVGADHTSEIYFPHWIHGRLHRGSTELELHGIVDEEEKVKARKMIITGLWCIQTDPNNRPAMHGVLDMFQGSIESLQIPPLPVMSLQPHTIHNT